MGIVFDTYHSLEGLALGDTRSPLLMGIVFDTREGGGANNFRNYIFFNFGFRILNFICIFGRNLSTFNSNKQ